MELVATRKYTTEIKRLSTTHMSVSYVGTKKV